MPSASRKSPLFLKRDSRESKSLKPFGVVDVESNEWIKFEFAGTYDGIQYQKHDSIKNLVTHITARKYRDFIWYGHNAGKFDYQFILEECLKRKIVNHIAMAGSRIVCIKLKTDSDRHYITLYDSFSLMQSSLKKLSETFKTETTKGEFDFKNQRMDRKNPTHIEYNRRDCESLYQIIKKFYSFPKINEVGHCVTTASMAMKIFKRHLPHNVRVTTQKTQDFCRKAYVGGRVDVFKRRGSPIFYHDVNSLYPYVMKAKSIPLEYIGRSDSHYDYGFHHVKVHVPETHIPLLPYKDTKNKKLIFPCGTFTGYFFSEELKEAELQGVKILSHYSGVKFTEEKNFFTEYIDTFWKMREENKGNALNYAAKCCLNHLYGKFGQREERESYEQITGKPSTGYNRISTNPRLTDEFDLYSIVTNQRSNFMLAHIACAITSHARIHLHRKLILNPSGTYYCDTDSILSNEKLETSDKLGDLKLEKQKDYGFFLAPKAYLLVNKGEKPEYKLKGFHKDYLSSVTQEEFEKMNLKYEKEIFAPLKSSLKRNNSFLSLTTLKKSLKTRVEKRFFYKNGESRAWIVEGNILK